MIKLVQEKFIVDEAPLKVKFVVVVKSIVPAMFTVLAPSVRFRVLELVLARLPQVIVCPLVFSVHRVSVVVLDVLFVQVS